MHELAIAQSLLNSISTWRDLNGGRKVLSAKIEMGRLSGVDPEAMEYAWKTACEFVCGGLFRDCRLELVQLPLQYSCPACNRNFESETLVSECPFCKGEAPKRNGGRELNLKSIEVE